MSYEIREATQDERDRFVRSSWRRTFVRPETTWWDPENVMAHRPTKDHQVPRRGRDLFVDGYVRMSRGARLQGDRWIAAHTLLIDHLLGLETTRVAVLDVAGECMGWVAWDSGAVHYVFVSDRARRRGLGTALLRHAIRLDKPRGVSHMTAAGEALVCAVLHPDRSNKAATENEPEGQAVHDG